MKENVMMVFNNEQFGDIRTVIINGEPWFVGKDICEAFGDTNYRRSLRRLDDEEKGVSQITTPGGNQDMAIINESGLYSLLFYMQPQKAKGVSQNDQAIADRIDLLKRFKRWVTSEVLPSIRKTGSYSNPKHRPMTEYQERLSRIREKDMNNKSAALWVKMGELYDNEMMQQICFAHASKELSGDFAIPLPVLPEKTYSAGEIGDILGISANAVGRLANANGLKQDNYGKWFADKAKSADKAVQTFRYYGKVIPLLRNLVNKEVES